MAMFVQRVILVDRNTKEAVVLDQSQAVVQGGPGDDRRGDHPGSLWCYSAPAPAAGHLSHPRHSIGPPAGPRGGGQTVQLCL